MLAYNEALKRHGLTIWFDPEKSGNAVPICKRGRQQSYNVAAIQKCMTIKVLFGMAVQQTAGFVESLLHLAGLDWMVPDFSTLDRSIKQLPMNIDGRRAHCVCSSIGPV